MIFQKFQKSLIYIMIGFPLTTAIINLAFDYRDSIRLLNEVGIGAILLLLVFGLVQGFFLACIWVLIFAWPINAISNKYKLSKAWILILSSSITFIAMLAFLSAIIFTTPGEPVNGYLFAYLGLISAIVIGALGGYGYVQAADYQGK